MPFSAINTYEQEIKQRNERHTLELQLEQAMQVYQSALEAQRVGNPEEANDQYTKLFAFDVLKPRKHSEKQEQAPEGPSSSSTSSGQQGASGMSARSLQLGPAIRLRAMALKNFALLLLTGTTVVAENVDKAFEFLSEALDLVGADDKEKLVLPSLVPIAWAIGFKRLARLGLEILVQNNDGSALVPLDQWIENKKAAYSLFGPRTIEYLKSLEYMKAIEEGKLDMEAPKFLHEYEHISQLKDEQPSLKSTLDAESHIEVSLSAKSWESLIYALNDALTSATKRSKRKHIKDSYSWSQKDLWSVEFVGTPFHRHDPPVITSSMEPEAVENEKEDTVESQITESLPQTPLPQTTLEPSTPITSPKSGETPASASPPEQKTGTEQQKDEDIGIQPNLVASPVKRRRVDRVKRSNLALPADFGVLDTNFVAQFNAYLDVLDQDNVPRFYSPAYLFLDPTQDIPSELVGAAKLRDVLSGWDSRESTQLLMEAASTKPQKGGIMITLRKGNMSELGSNEEEDEYEDDMQSEDIIEESLAVEQFVSQHNNMHIQQIRWPLARILLQKLASGGQKKAFGRLVYTFIDEIESMLWSRRQFLNGNECAAIFSLYADRWIQNKNKELGIRMTRWQSVSSMHPGLPHAWISAFVNQESDTASPESSVLQFEGILEFMTFNKSNIDEAYLKGLFSYLSEIPILTVANLQMQISKFKAAAAFERVLTPPNASADSEEHTNNDDIQLLEAMLMPETHKKPDSTSDDEFESIQNFLGYAQPQFKMGLWYILLEKYEASGSYVDSFLGLTKIFTEAINSLDNGEPLLQVLSVAHDVGKRLVPLLERNPTLLAEHWSLDSALVLLEQSVKLLQTLHLFSLYDDAVNSNLLQKPITPSWPRALLKFRELVVMWWCIFYRFWIRCIPEHVAANQETVNDILSIIHERLGNLGYCGVANFCLLNLHFSEIARIDWDGSALDMSQCLKCKFGLNMSLYGDVANHHTITTQLKQKEALLLLPFVMRMILHHRSFQQAVMRMDTRAVIDEFSNAYGTKEDDMKHKKQVTSVENYLSRDFSPELLRRAWSGYDDTKLSYVDGDDAQGIWLVQAGVLMNQYKMRRRQAYSPASIRTESLQSAIDLYIEDIAAKPTRLESWVGIAQAYTYLCEDCLIFGDELVLDNEPQLYCKKALLAASRAVSLQVSEGHPGCQQLITVAQKESFESVKVTIWSLFGYALLLAVMPPLVKEPFATSSRPPQPLLVELPTNQTIRLGIKKPDVLNDKIALRIALRCMSKHNDPQIQWVNFMHQTMAAFELDLGPEQVLSYALKAKELAPNGVYDADLEIIHVGYHYFREQKWSEEELRKTFAGICVGRNTEEPGDVKELVEGKLRWLINKNKWLHRPHYLLAKMCELDNNDTNAAQQELMQLFSLKSPSKPLVIWKTDSDLPGQHGVYMTQYVRYMADLMYINKDSAGLLLMARRFRKTGAEMWDHTGTYEYIYGQTCSLVHQQLPLSNEASQKPKQSDALMSEVADNSEKFEATVDAMATVLEREYNENDMWTLALYYVVELRRLHSGPSTIALADELLIVIFLTIYKKFSTAHPELAEDRVPQEGPPGPVEATNTETDGTNTNKTTSKKNEKPPARKKIIRKDVIHSAQVYLKPVQQTLAKYDDLRMPKDLSI